MISNKKQGLAYFTFIAGLIIVLFAIASTLPPGSVMAAGLAQTAPPLGAVGSYSILAGTTVTNTGGSTMPGDLGVSPGSAIDGFPPGSVGPPGEIRTITAAALAQSDADVARLALEALGPGTTIGSELGGVTLTPGVYTVPGISYLTGTEGDLTLNGSGVYIFLTNGLTSSGNVVLTDGADACNVFWRDASSVSITGGNFVGTIIALTSISMGDGASLQGRAIAQNGAVTLINNTFTGAECLTAPIEPATTAPTNLTAMGVSTSQIDLAWSDNASDETAYSVERSPDGSSGWPEIAEVGENITTYNDTGLNPGETWYYRVRAYNADDDQYSEYSNVANATTWTSSTAPVTAEPELLPDTGGDLTESQVTGTQGLRISLGILGISLVLFGFLLIRDKRILEK